MAPVKKKIKRRSEVRELMSPAAQKKIEREIDKRIAEIEADASDKGEAARKIFNRQDAKTKQAIEQMISTMDRMSGPDNFITLTLDEGGQVTVRGDQSIFDDLRLWIAIRLLNVAYTWGIQVASFTPVRKISKKAGAR